MAVCTPESTAAASACFACALNDHQLQAIKVYLLAVLAGGSMDPATLMAAAKDFQAFNSLNLAQLEAYLTCQIAG